MALTQDQLDSIIKNRVSALSAGRKEREEEREKREQEQKRLNSLKESIGKKQDYLRPEDLTNLQEAFIARDFDAVKEINNTLAEREEGDSGVIAKTVQFGAGLARGAWDLGDKAIVQPVDALLSQGEGNMTNVEQDAEARNQEFQERAKNIAARQESGELTREQADNLREASKEQFDMEEGKNMARTDWAGDDESDRFRIAAAVAVEAGFSLAGANSVRLLAKGTTKLMAADAAAVATKSFGKETIRSQVFRSTLGGAGAGGGVGFGVGLQGDTLDWGRIAKGTGTGVVVGGAIGGGLSAAIGRYGSKKAGKEAAEAAVEPVVTKETNPSRLLGTGKERLQRELNEVEDEIAEIRNQDPNSYSTNPEDIRALEGEPVDAQAAKSMGWGDNVQMVKTSKLDEFAEFDRQAEPIGQERYNELKADIQKNGIQDPLILSYDAAGRTAYLGEGNHRLAIAKELGIEDLPVEVSGVQSRSLSGADTPVPGATPDEFGYVPSNQRPSDIGVPGEAPGGTVFARTSGATVADASQTVERARALNRRRAELQQEITDINQQVLENTAGKNYNYTKNTTQPVGPDGKKLTDPGEIKQAKAQEAYDDTTQKLEAIKNNPEAAEVTTGADYRTGRKIKKLDQEFALNEDKTADDAAKYIAKRTKLVDSLEDPKTELGKQMSKKDVEIQQAYDKGDYDAVVRAADERGQLETEAMMQAQQRRNQDIVDGKVTSNVAKNIEADAIARGMSEEFDALAQSDKITILAQVNRAVDHIKAKPDEGMAIAMGKQQPPEGTFASAYVVAAERAAIESGNNEMIAQLGTSKVLEKSTREGQSNAIYAARDPESPIHAMRAVMQARTKNKNRAAVLTKAEQNTIIEMGKSTMDKRASLIEKGAKATDDERLDYGLQSAQMRKYVGGLLKDAERNYKDIVTDTDKSFTMRGIEAGWKGITDSFGFAKSAVGAWDNSFVGRQGLKVLADNPKMWAKESARSFKNFAKGFTDEEAELLTEAYVLSRPNNLNGMYKKMGLDVVGITEEAIPNRGPESTPGVGRVFRASNAAYTGFAQRARVDTADMMLALSKDVGGDLSDPGHLKAIGSFANNLTGRGALGEQGERVAESINKVFFSPRLMVSNLNFLSAHQADPRADAFIKARARKNVMKASVGAALALSAAEGLLGAEVEKDPRSSDFGKFKVGNTRFDISGGTSSLITLGARIITQSSKSTNTGEVTDFNEAGPFDQTFSGTLLQFVENKLSPGAGGAMDVIQKEMFGGEDVTAMNLIKDISIPLSVQNWEELNDDEDSAATFPTMMAEIMGIGTINYGFDVDIKTKDSKEVEGFKKAVSTPEFNEASELVDESFRDWWAAVQSEVTYQQLSKDRRESLIQSERNRIMSEIFSEYGYEYKRQSATTEEEDLIEGLRGLGL